MVHDVRTWIKIWYWLKEKIKGMVHDVRTWRRLLKSILKFLFSAFGAESLCSFQLSTIS